METLKPSLGAFAKKVVVSGGSPHNWGEGLGPDHKFCAKKIPFLLPFDPEAIETFKNTKICVFCLYLGVVKVGLLC